MKDGALDVEFLYQSDVNVEQIDMIDPVEYADKYTPYKYGVIARERLFVKNDSIVALDFRLMEIDSNSQNSQPIAAAKPPAPKGKGGKDAANPGLEIKSKLKVIANLMTQ